MIHPDLSIVVLAYRSANVISGITYSLMKEISDENISYEIVLVGNYMEGTDDPTPTVVQKLANEHSSVIRAIVHPKRGMMGWDMRSGLDSARGKIVAVMDGDGQMLTIDVLKCYRTLIQGNYDLVKTRRIKRYDGAYRRILSRGYNLIFAIVFPKVNATDINSKPKVFRREIYSQMKLCSDDWFIDAEIMIEASRLRARTAEIDSIFLENSMRPSFVNVGTILEFVGNLIKYRIRHFLAKFASVLER